MIIQQDHARDRPIMRAVYGEAAVDPIWRFFRF
jgi:hypothetical protein